MNKHFSQLISVVRAPGEMTAGTRVANPRIPARSNTIASECQCDTIKRSRFSDSVVDTSRIGMYNRKSFEDIFQIMLLFVFFSLHI